MTIEAMNEQLEEAAELLDDELGEYWRALTQLIPVYKNGASDEFAAALEKELQEQYTMLKEDFRLVSKEVTHTYTEQRLVHFSEEG